MQILKAHALSAEGKSTEVFIYLLFTFMQNQLQVLTLGPWHTGRPALLLLSSSRVLCLSSPNASSVA